MKSNPSILLHSTRAILVATETTGGLAVSAIEIPIQKGVVYLSPKDNSWASNLHRSVANNRKLNHKQSGRFTMHVQRPSFSGPLSVACLAGNRIRPIFQTACEHFVDTFVHLSG